MDFDTVMEFLFAHQPLPFDSEFTQDLLDQLREVIRYVDNHPDARFVRPLFFSMGNGTGCDEFKHIIDVLADYPTDQVIPTIEVGLAHENTCHHENALWLASFVADRRICDQVRQLTLSSKTGTSDLAVMAYYNFVDETDRNWINSNIEQSQNEDLRARLSSLIDVLNEKRDNDESN